MQMQNRIGILSTIFFILFLFLLVRLFYWQFVRAQDLSLAARGQRSKSEVTKAARGNIKAADGSFWVIRSQEWQVFANTNAIDKPVNEVADSLTPFFVEGGASELLNEADRIKTLLGKKANYVPIKARIDGETKKKIESLNIKGIGFDEEDGRLYPEASSAAQLLGFVGKDDNGADVGYFGLEGYYNLPLQGKPGFVSREKNARGVPILLDPAKSISAISGVDLATNIDKRVQLIIESKLKEGVEKYGALGGSVTVMDPKNGNILGIANFPSYDPGKYWEYNNALFKNPVISDSFEPGSIMKVLVMAAGLDAGIVTPETECAICSGPLKLDKYSIKTWNNEYRPNISMTDVIVYSDNVGMAFVGQKLGADRLYDYLSKFGIGKTTGIDLQGEGAPQLRRKGTWSSVDLATASFGQGVAVTGIQMVRAVSAIANGGYLYTPRVVRAIEGDGWQEEIKSDPPQKVISSKAAGEITQMMVEAADRGEAKWTKIPGFTVAGKTGTAQIPIEGYYDPTNTNHSFIGFAPAVGAKFVMLVTLKSPKSSPWAAETAAPLWYSIAKELFPYLGVEPGQ